MGRFTVIPLDTFDTLQLDAGVLLKRFNPAAPAIVEEDIITATTGGINPSCVPTFSDLGEDVDNVPSNMKELKHLDGWDCAIATTSLGTSAEFIKMSLGCADINAETSAIIPRADLKQSDFSGLWWVGDKANGGFVAIQLKNALSTAGFSLQTSKGGKGQIPITLTGHVSIDNQKEVPMVFYSIDPTESEFYSVKQTLVNVTSNYSGDPIESGDSLELTLTADSGYTIANVVVLMGGEDVTSDSYSAGTVEIASVTDNVTIIATAVAD